MNTTNLPPLPIAAVDEHNLQGGRLLYSRDQMQAYARAAILQERERNALVCAGIAAGHAGAARQDEALRNLNAASEAMGEEL